MARSFKQRGTVVVPLAESPIPMVEVESIDNPAIFSETIAGEGNITGLTVYGKSTQDGVPSPKSPVPIVSAGDGGSIGLTVSNSADQSQQLTISTPTGLPGIPVTSGGNYTDASGQQRICDVTDLNSGLFYSNVVYFDLSSYADAIWYTWGVSNGAEGLTGFFMYIHDETKMDVDYKIISNILPYSAEAFGGVTVGIGIGSANTATPYIICTVQNTDLNDTSSNDAAVQSFKDLLKGKQCYALSARHAAVTFPIPPEELTAYRALQTYDGTTVISVNSDPIAPDIKTTVKVIDPNSGNPQIMRLWLDKEGHPVNVNGRGARVGGTPTQQYILQPCSF